VSCRHADLASETEMAAGRLQKLADDEAGAAWRLKPSRQPAKAEASSGRPSGHAVGEHGRNAEIVEFVAVLVAA
jgi:hypothetical protein